MHPLLAFVYFFRMFFGRKLPADAVNYLPEEAKPKAALPPPAEDKPKVKPVEKPVEKAKPEDKPRVPLAQHHKDGALALLALMQREGRLVDFLREPLDGFSDADIGAAARVVHEGCRKVLDEHFAIAPVRSEAEGSRLTLAEGFDAAAVRLTGKVVGKPPFTGTLGHRGWRVTDTRLPALAEGHDASVIAQAEVEL